MPFLPITREEMKERGIEQFDFVYVIGDAYVDHSSFGPAIISVCSRRTAIPSASSHSRTGRTRTAFRFSVNRVLAFLSLPEIWIPWSTIIPWRKSTEKQMPYAGRCHGKTAGRAVTVYGNLIRRTYKHTPMILGGIEHRSGAFRITITGLTRCAAPSFSIPVRI